MSLIKDASSSQGIGKGKKGQKMSAGTIPAATTEADRDQSLSSLIHQLIQIRDQREIMADIDHSNRIAEVAQAFAQLPQNWEYANTNPGEEFSDYIFKTRAKSIEQRQQCEKALRGKMDNDTLTKVRENIHATNLEICAFLENIVMVLKPELLPAIDAAL